MFGMFSKNSIFQIHLLHHRTLLAVAVLLCRESFLTLMSADLARVRSSKPTAPVWSALFNHSLFERNVMRIVAGFAVSEFSEGACLPAG